MTLRAKSRLHVAKIRFSRHSTGMTGLDVVGNEYFRDKTNTALMKYKVSRWHRVQRIPVCILEK
jgi:hypothetical protein